MVLNRGRPFHLGMGVLVIPLLFLAILAANLDFTFSLPAQVVQTSPVKGLEPPDHIRHHPSGNSANIANKENAWNLAMNQWAINGQGPDQCWGSKGGRLLLLFKDIVLESAGTPGKMYRGVVLFINGDSSSAICGVRDPITQEPGWFSSERSSDPFFPKSIPCPDDPYGLVGAH